MKNVSLFVAFAVAYVAGMHGVIRAAVELIKSFRSERRQRSAFRRMCFACQRERHGVCAYCSNAAE